MIMAPQIFLSGLGTKPVSKAESGILVAVGHPPTIDLLSDDHGIA
jgi:hypothetical protein